jgi:hypothetical protein
MPTLTSQHVLNIYIMPNCFGSERAYQLADRIGTWRIPNLAVRLCDLSHSDSSKPVAVVAVPAYVLDGRVISLGTPDEPWLYQLLVALDSNASGSNWRDQGRS